MNGSVIGNIQKVKWHYRHHGLGRGIHGYACESYTPEEMYITTKHPHLNDVTMTMNDSMDENKNYACVFIENEELVVRNLFVSSDPKGFEQKNTYFKDNCCGMFILEDPNGLVLEYIKKGRPDVNDLKKTEYWYELFFCVEYEIKEGFNNGLLDYIVIMNLKYNGLKSRLDKIEEEIGLKKDGNVINKWWFKKKLNL